MKIQKKTKKIMLIAISCIVALAIIGVSLYLVIPIKIKIDMSTVEKIETNVVLEKINGVNSLSKTDENGNATDEPFKILAFTDTHLDTYFKKTEVTMEMLIANITAEQPDLVVFVGDNVTSSNNKQRTIQFCEVMEKFGVYWAAVLGNHEGDNARSISRQKMVEIFASYPHCLVEDNKKVTKNGEEVFGWGNYQINLLCADSSVRQALFFLDGGNRVSKEAAKKYNIDKESYDFLKESQIKWYGEQVEKLDDGTKSMMYLHIALSEYTTAYDEIKADGEVYNVENADGTILADGLRREGECASKYNSGMFDEIVRLGSTQAVVVGHDHMNDYRVRYKGVWLCYNQMSGYSSYNVITKKKGDKLIQGCSIYIISSEGEITFDKVINANKYDQTKAMELYK